MGRKFSPFDPGCSVAVTGHTKLDFRFQEHVHCSKRWENDTFSMKIAHSLKEQFMFQKTVMLRRWGFEVKHENLALNELINVKLLPQKHCEADFSSFSNLCSL